MNKQIPFPKNYDRYIELGQELMDQGNLLAALDSFQRAYEIKKDFPLNFLISSTYLEVGENKKALYMALEMKDNYLTCLDYLSFYIQLLVSNQQFIHAHSLINDRILQEKCGEMHQLVALKKKIRQEELIYEQFEASKINQLKEQLSCLEQHSYYEQLAIVKKAVYLPQDDFFKIGKKILLDKKVHPLVRSWVLEKFAGLHVKEQIKVLWGENEQHQVIPAQIGGPLDCASYEQMMLFLEKELINDNPILLLDLREEVRLHFALLYPVADKIIKEPKLWAISYILAYNESLAEYYQIQEFHREIELIQQLQTKIRCDLEEMVF